MRQMDCFLVFLTDDSKLNAWYTNNKAPNWLGGLTSCLQWKYLVRQARWNTCKYNIVQIRETEKNKIVLTSKTEKQKDPSANLLLTD